MKEKAQIVDLGFSVADADDVKINYKNDNLVLSFNDWKEVSHIVTFAGVSGFKWQEAEFTLDFENERFDETHEILNSEWIKQHQDQNELVSDEKPIHYKFNFNADGVFEFICTEIKIILSEP